MNQPIVTYKSNLNSIIISNIINENYDVEQYRSDVKKLLSEHENISTITFGGVGALFFDVGYPEYLYIDLLYKIFDILVDYPIETLFFRSKQFYSDEVEIANFIDLLDMIYHSQLFYHFKKLTWNVYGGPPIVIRDEYLDKFAETVAKFALIDESNIPEIYIGDWRGSDVIPKIINAAINKKIAENKQNKGNLNSVIYIVANSLTTLNLPGLPEEVWLNIGRRATGIDYGRISKNPNTYFLKNNTIPK